MEQIITTAINWCAAEKVIVGRSYKVSIDGDSGCDAVVVDVNADNIDNIVDRLEFDEIVTFDSVVNMNLGHGNSGGVHPKLSGCKIQLFDNDNTLLAAGYVVHTLHRSSNVVWQAVDVDRVIRSDQKQQIPKTYWFTGLSGSGKSTLANLFEQKLVEEGFHTMLLDGDNIRHGLNKNLGFNEKDRVENIRRVAEVAKLMNDAGLVVLAAFISPYSADREVVREIVGSAYVEIHVNTPLKDCELRDIKGLYAKARAGLIPNFTGISAPYEEPLNPDFAFDTSTENNDEILDTLMSSIDD